MEDLAAALHPRHGTLVMNLHGSGPPIPSLARWVAGLLARKDGGAAKHQPGYDPDSAEGRAIQRTGAAFRCSRGRLRGSAICAASPLTLTHGYQFNRKVPH